MTLARPLPRIPRPSSGRTSRATGPGSERRGAERTNRGERGRQGGGGAEGRRKEGRPGRTRPVEAGGERVKRTRRVPRSPPAPHAARRRVPGPWAWVLREEWVLSVLGSRGCVFSEPHQLWRPGGVPRCQWLGRRCGFSRLVRGKAQSKAGAGSCRVVCSSVPGRALCGLRMRTMPVTAVRVCDQEHVTAGGGGPGGAGRALWGCVCTTDRGCMLGRDGVCVCVCVCVCL